MLFGVKSRAKPLQKKNRQPQKATTWSQRKNYKLSFCYEKANTPRGDCGGRRIRTSDFQVMSLTSWPLLYSAT